MKKNVAQMGLYLALALILSYVESLIPFYFGIPGVKLGLTNLIVVMMLYQIGGKEAFSVSLLRIVLAGFLFGNMFSILYSLAGGILSFLLMYLAKKTKLFHLVTVSIVGGISHNIGQILVAYFIVNNGTIFYWIPVLLVAGIMTGGVIGVLSSEMIRRIGTKW